MDQTEKAEQNIRTIYERQKSERESVSVSQKIMRKIADFAGTITFAVVNAIFFIAWISLNMTIWPFDPYPFTLLITIVSLESIFLSIIVLISQNELTVEQDRRNNLDLQVNLLLEQESTEIIKVILLMARKMEIDEEHLAALEGLAQDTCPEEMLEKIEAIEKEEP